MISRRALFAGAAGAVVAASTVGKALASGPLIMGVDLSGGPDMSVAVIRSGNRILSVEQVEAELGMLWKRHWITQDEALEKYPHAD